MKYELKYFENELFILERDWEILKNYQFVRLYTQKRILTKILNNF